MNKSEAGDFDSANNWDSILEFAPSLPELLSKSRDVVDTVAQSGAQIGDFQIVSLLGEGAFGKVYLARQVSLEREVALKVTANLGHEGRMMARLQHANIVQVFSETVDEERGLRWLCMQYVPGATLQQIIRDLRRLDRRDRRGISILDIVGEYSVRSAAFDPASLRLHEQLSQCDLEEAVCLIGRQLAEALAYAHRSDVLHLDIKPANVVVNQYGQPMLMDFSLSFSATATERLGTAVIGGTWGYMAPEQFHALNPEHPSQAEVIGAFSDIYSLGAVLLDLYTGEPAGAAERTAIASGRLPSEDPRIKQDVPAVLKEANCPRPLGAIMERCLQYDPAARFGSAGELADALAGCFDLFRSMRRLPPLGRSTAWATKHPLAIILWLTVLPNFAASALNIAYNALVVIQELDPDQRAAFGSMVFWYNFITLLFIAPWTVYVLLPTRGWYQLAGGESLSPERLDEIRRQTLALPGWGLFLAVVGWLPFVVVVPLGMEWLAGPVDRGVLLQISVAFLVTGLIMMAANYYVISFVVIRAMYPRLWGTVSRFCEVAAAELATVPRRNRVIQVISGLTPLGAVVFLALLGPGYFTPEAFARFRVVIVVLIGAGIAGFWLATVVTSILNQCVAAYVGGTTNWSN